LEAAAGKAAAAGENIGQYLLAELQEPLRGVAPGQMFVMYDGQQVLGAATIVAYGPTRAESGGA
jgi:tRNA U34 2-thiouridine synthase MnmA/TrmU